MGVCSFNFGLELLLVLSKLYAYRTDINLLVAVLLNGVKLNLILIFYFQSYGHGGIYS